MDYQITFKVNNKIYLRDPEATEIGKHIINSSIDLIYHLGFEHFTFKKLAVEIQTTEATIYRYFENKHRLLLYILNWYWSYLEFLVVFQLMNIKNPKAKLEAILDLLTHEFPENAGKMSFNKTYLNHIIITESSKVYLVKEVQEINKDEVFKPYKDLCAKIAEVISEYNPKYKYPKSMSSTLIETAYHQQYFSAFLPKLTDLKNHEHVEFTSSFLNDLLFKTIS